MQPDPTDGVMWSVRVSVCHDRVPCETAELIKMPIEMWTRGAQGTM